MPLAVIGLVLLISGPSMLIANVKLRQRNLAPILDANGWAVNSLAGINFPFGASLTQLAARPPGAERTLQDPFAEKATPWKTYRALTLLLAARGYVWHQGYLGQWWDRFRPKTAETGKSETGGGTPSASPTATPVKTPPAPPAEAAKPAPASEPKSAAPAEPVAPTPP